MVTGNSPYIWQYEVYHIAQLPDRLVPALSMAHTDWIEGCILVWGYPLFMDRLGQIFMHLESAKSIIYRLPENQKQCLFESRTSNLVREIVQRSGSFLLGRFMEKLPNRNHSWRTSGDSNWILPSNQTWMCSLECFYPRPNLRPRLATTLYGPLEMCMPLFWDIN